ncbi:MAG: hypothetical protein ABW321_07215 [Polyangiales bacterium]
MLEDRERASGLRWGVWAVWLCLAACNATPPAGVYACVSHGDCPDNMLCVSGRCDHRDDANGGGRDGGSAQGGQAAGAGALGGIGGMDGVGGQSAADGGSSAAAGNGASSASDGGSQASGGSGPPAADGGNGAAAGSSAPSPDPGTGAAGGGSPNPNGWPSGSTAIAEPSSACEGSQRELIACARHVTQERVKCDGATWQPLDRCERLERCDTLGGPSAGTCRSIAAACSGKQPAATTCVSEAQTGVCGADLVSVEPGELCPAPQTCDEGVCSCACDGVCYDLKTDASHCGRCDRTCGARACSDGQCEPEVFLTGGEYADIAVDATHVYWVTPGARTLTMRSADGAQEMQLADNVDSNALLVDESRVYFGTAAGIAKLSKPDGSASLFVPNLRFSFVAQNATQLFSYFAGNIHVIAKDSGAETTLSLSNAIRPTRLTASERHVYLTETDTGKVMQLAIGTGELTEITTKAEAPFDILYAGGYVYWTARSGLSRISVDDGAVELIGESTARLASDGTHVYTTTRNKGGILYTPLAKVSPLKTLAQRATPIYDLALQGTYAYWVETLQGDQCPCALMRTPR